MNYFLGLTIISIATGYEFRTSSGIMLFGGGVMLAGIVLWIEEED